MSHETETPVVTRSAHPLVRMIPVIEKAIFSIRWMLIPLYAGLVAALVLYILHFLHEIFDMISAFWHNYNDQNILMLFILELVDMVMISQLVVMTVQGGYSIFVKEFDYELLKRRPRWLTNNLGSSEQKIKMGMSIIGIMIVHFLKDFVEGKINQEQLWMRIQMLLCVIVATFAFCFYNILMHLPMLTQGHAGPAEHKNEADHNA